MAAKKKVHVNKKDPNAMCQFHIFDVPRVVKDRFKAACAKQGISMRDVVIDLLDDYGK